MRKLSTTNLKNNIKNQIVIKKIIKQIHNSQHFMKMGLKKKSYNLMRM